MHVICNDGTTIRCQDFEATDSGVLFFQETPGRRESEEEDESDEEDERSADGFVPVTQLRFVLPDEMVQQTGTQPAGVPQSGPGGVPPAGQQGGMAQQQQMQQSPSAPPQRRPPDSGGR